jgi:L-lactate utilization protein LutB
MNNRIPTINQLTERAIMGEITEEEIDSIIAKVNEKVDKNAEELKKLKQLQKLAEMVKAGITKKLSDSIDNEDFSITRDSGIVVDSEPTMESTKIM